MTIHRFGLGRWTVYGWRLCLLAAVVITAPACAPHLPKASFDAHRCMQQVPRHVKGLKILEGPRSAPSIIKDMVPAVCNAQVLFDRMRGKNPSLTSGHAVYHVVVEYTGEVQYAAVAETDMLADQLLQKVADFIKDTDFVSWPASDTDAEFLYPIRFIR